MMDQLHAWLAMMQGRYASLEKREKYALISLGVFSLLLAFYLGIWSPLNNLVTDNRVERDRHLELLLHFKSTESRARASANSHGDSPASSQNLLSEISRSAQIVGVAPSRMQPEGADAVSVWYQEVNFNRMMMWLEQLESHQGISVRQVTMEPTNRPGIVTARFVLRR